MCILVNLSVHVPQPHSGRDQRRHRRGRRLQDPVGRHGAALVRILPRVFCVKGKAAAGAPARLHACMPPVCGAARVHACLPCESLPALSTWCLPLPTACDRSRARVPARLPACPFYMPAPASQLRGRSRARVPARLPFLMAMVLHSCGFFLGYFVPMVRRPRELLPARLHACLPSAVPPACTRACPLP
jgi:hypothetical protein